MNSEVESAAIRSPEGGATPDARRADLARQSAGYFGFARTDILPLVPPGVSRAAEIGCGEGATLRLLQMRGLCTHTTGIEYSEVAAETARKQVDEVHVGDVERMTLPFAPESLDLVLCLDVLEHLRDPWAMVKRLHGVMRPGATLIASLPNVRQLRVSAALLFGGRWEYRDEGILDRTHLRFFVRETAKQLFESQGFHVTAVKTKLPTFSASRIIDTATFGLMRDLLTHQFLIAATRP